MAMVRKQVYIESEQQAQLRKIARKLAIPEAELIRQGIDLYLSSSYTLPQDRTRWEEALEVMRSRISPVPSKKKRNWTRAEIYD